MAPRTRKRVKVHETSNQDASTSQATEGFSESKTKKNATGVRRRGTIRGKLSKLLEMPMEIFTEVACYMTPEDLLNLARTSAGLREILMSKSSKRVWQAARTVQGTIPPCPSDLSEPQYADLLFGKGCSFCHEPRTRRVDVTLRSRACKKCSSEFIGDLDDLYWQNQNSLSIANIDLSKLRSLVPTALYKYTKQTRYQRTYFKICIASHFQDLIKKVNELSTEAADLEAYLEDRKKTAKAIYDSVEPIERWLTNVSNLKERENEELKKERKASIIARLRALGYEDEDFETRYDPKGWKWKHLVEQTRAVSERVWENIRPELEEIIKLRRAHASAQFLELRRSKRQNEFEEKFVDSRPQIFSLPFGKIFARGDFQEQPFIDEILHENDSKLPLDKERWLRCLDFLPETMVKHAKENIESYVVRVMNEANAKATEELKATRYAPMIDNNELQLDDPVENVDCIPTSLLSATSLFKYDRRVGLEDYTALLHRRSSSSLPSWARGGSAWSSVKFTCTSSGPIVFTASLLLKHLQLPERTSMAFMLGCGADFRCLTCLRASESQSMTWGQLVDHFVYANDKFHTSLKTIKYMKLQIPYLNDHDLDSEVHGNLVARIPRTTVDIQPTDFTANRYSQLSSALGVEVVYTKVLEFVKDTSDGDPEELDPGNFNVDTKYCPMCKQFNSYHYESNLRGMRKHMRTRHGTDLEGNPLSDQTDVVQPVKVEETEQCSDA
ncbi:hypothetical protein SCHPADRAFT_862357 [Schizopora paradoxa]|uniref:F-box domain-containing protein n=1 Tax=Schizopora paradoxa TaxID=27342 RepID=A0A0H2R7R1_9AGAM|nr:hypothetical protein SCHPADRAFT_862357 [Schizopora paradoxa]